MSIVYSHHYFAGQKVSTPYGEGIVREKRDTHVVVTPTNWLLNGNQPPLFFLNPRDVTPDLRVGDEVECIYGKGSIIEIRSADNIHVVSLSNWLLANGRSPTLYLNHTQLKRTTTSNQASIVTASKKVIIMPNLRCRGIIMSNFHIIGFCGCPSEDALWNRLSEVS